MCGIAGIINFRSPEEKRAVLLRMIGLMAHRGPDAAGIMTGIFAGLAHARLSIIDLSGGDQPIYNEDQSVWVVFNGEIFNYPELRSNLIRKGHQFYTQTDTEVLVHLYEEKGSKMFADLNGQFAIALWDQKKQTLLLARDRMGICPLFYHLHNGRLVFGSEIKAIFADDGILRELDIQNLSDIFICWSPLGEGTAFRNIYQVLPGHFAEFSAKGFSTEAYWRLPYGEEILQDVTLSAWVEQLIELFTDAVKIRLRADVPVGAYLSGGLDSTFTSSVIKKRFNNLLNTFSITFTDKRFDESLFQQIAADSIQTEHHVVHCSETDIGEVFPKVIWHTEVPILRTSPSPLFRLSRLVRDHNFKVVLTGEGADEVFAGYNIFKEDKIRRFWARNPASRIRPRLLERIYPYVFSQGEKHQTFIENFFKKGMQETDVPAYSHMIRWQNTSQIRNFFSNEIRGTTGGIEDFLKRFYQTLPLDFMKWESLPRSQYIESAIFLPNYLLCSQGERMTMANSVEGRYPFLDHRLVEFASRIPTRYRINGLTEKFVLKQAAKTLIPSELIKRPKQPYRAPISKCFINDQPLGYVDEMLSEDTLKNSGYFDHKKVAILVKKCNRQNGNILSERENMSLVGILSTQLLEHLFIKNFPFQIMTEPKHIKEFKA